MESKTINWSGSRFVDKPDSPPVFEKNHPMHGIISTHIAKIERILQPMPREEMAAVLYRLQGHYWQNGMSEALARSVAADYLRLLGDCPEKILTKACDDWLLNPENAYFPKVGALKALIDAEIYRHKWNLKKLKLMIGGV